MLVLAKDIWLFQGFIDAICITTNGSVKSNGCAVMGRGVAKEALEHFPGIDRILGLSLKAHGNVPVILRENPAIVSFPTKPGDTILSDTARLLSWMVGRYKIGQKVPGWAFKSDLEIIKTSARILRDLADRYSWSRIVLPLPGCGNGELSWGEVEKVLDQYLDGRFFCVKHGE